LSLLISLLVANYSKFSIALITLSSNSLTLTLEPFLKRTTLSIKPSENELIEFRISVPVQKSVRLITERSLKGVANKIYQSSASCSFSEGLMERVVLFKKGSNVRVRELDDNVIKAIENLE